jgi:hypothetical protein
MKSLFVKHLRFAKRTSCLLSGKLEARSLDEAPDHGKMFHVEHWKGLGNVGEN